GDVPLAALAVRRHDERTLARADQYPHTAHLSLLLSKISPAGGLEPESPRLMVERAGPKSTLPSQNCRSVQLDRAPATRSGQGHAAAVEDCVDTRRAGQARSMRLSTMTRSVALLPSGIRSSRETTR